MRTIKNAEIYCISLIDPKNSLTGEIVVGGTMTTESPITLTPDYAPADPNKLSHIFRGEENPQLWVDGMRAQDLVNLARDLQMEITALCGHKLTPTLNPSEHDVCPVCVKVWNGLA